MAEIDAAVLATLLQPGAAGSGLMVNSVKPGEQIYQWYPDTWGYTNAQASAIAKGFCGMGRDLHSLKYRLRYRVSHIDNTNARYPVTAEISYEGPTPPSGQARAFFIPFAREQQAKYLVIAFAVKAGPGDAAMAPRQRSLQAPRRTSPPQPTARLP